MRHLLPILLFVSYMHAGFSQDQIVTKDGVIHDCNITSTDSVNIYISVVRNSRNINTFIKKEDVQSVTYRNNQKNASYKNSCSDKIVASKSDVNKVLLGVGMHLGLFNPKEVYEFVNGYAEYNNLAVGHSFDNIYFSFSGLLGYQISESFSLNFSADMSTSIKNAYNDNYEGNSFSLDKKTLGMFSNFKSATKNRMNFVASLGPTYNSISFSTGKKQICKANNFGFRLQGGLNYSLTSSFELQGLLGYDYARAKYLKSNEYKPFDMNYSGLLGTLNAIIKL